MVHRSILPENRRSALRTLLQNDTRPVRIMEAHNGLSAMIANDASVVNAEGKRREFDGIWVSGLTESASRALPDIELLGMQSRVAVVREIINVTRKPILIDGDTGGTIDQLQYCVHELETLGVSGLIIEDKVFPKSNSLDFNKPQTLEDPEVFARKIRAGREAVMSRDFMLIARIEALVAKRELGEALRRAEKYLEAGADGIVIHSRQKSPDEILAFARGYAGIRARTGIDRPLICIPTTYNSITERELHEAGCRLVIHANHLLRSAYSAMKKTAESILHHERSFEVEPACASLSSLFEVLDSSGPGGNSGRHG